MEVKLLKFLDSRKLGIAVLYLILWVTKKTCFYTKDSPYINFLKILKDSDFS